MPQKCVTPADPGVARNSCGGWFRDRLTPLQVQAQAIPNMIALHIGKQFCARWAEGCEDG